MRNKRAYIGASRKIAAERYDYSDGERMGQPIANKEIQVKENGRWIRYTTTWSEFVDMYVQDARDRGYEDVRVVNATTSIRKHRKITAADDDEFEDPRIDEADDLQARVEDDFDYVITGIERLGREGLLDEAISLLNTLADTLDSAIGIIGNDFEAGDELSEESEEI